MRKKLFLAILLISLSMMASCAIPKKNAEEALLNEESSSYTSDIFAPLIWEYDENTKTGHLNGDVSEMISLDATVKGVTTDVEQKEAASVLANIYPITINQLSPLFWGDHVIAEQDIREEGVKGQTYQGMDYPYYCYHFMNLDRMISTGLVTDYETMFSYPVQQSFSADTANVFHNKEEYSSGKEWDFISSKDAYLKVCEAMNALGVDLSDDYQVYSLDYETMKKQNKEMMDSLDAQTLENESVFFKEDWSEEDNCYYFVMRQSINGLPVTDQRTGDSNLGTDTLPSSISAIYSKNGIEYVHITCPYAPVSSGETKKLISLNTAVQSFSNALENVMLSDHSTVTEIQLAYVSTIRTDYVKAQFELIPSWIFTLKMPILGVTSEENRYEYVSIVIDARTGAEIL